MIKVKTKKWIIVLSVLVAIAIAVTLIIVLLPKDYKRIISMTQEHCESIYLKKNKDEELYKNFQDKIDLVYKDSYGVESDTVHSVLDSLGEVVDFYSEYIVFAENNKYFQKSYKPIVKGFENVSKYEDEMRKIVVDVNSKLGNQDNTFIASAWQKFKEYFQNYLKAYSKVISSLNNIFENCITDGIIQNEMTSLVLDTVDDYLDSIASDFDSSKTKVEYFTKFISYLQYPNGRAILARFNFDGELQDSIKLVQNFSKFYQDSNLKTLIDSVNDSGFTFQGSEDETTGILETSEMFLKGEVK